MKLTQKHPIKSKSGMTLLELTVVILVLLSLISILFIGARAWKRGSDRAASILQIRNVQQAVRSFSNMNVHNPGDTVETLEADIFGTAADGDDPATKGFLETDPRVKGHPAGTGYAFEVPAPTIIPAIGSLYMVTVAGENGGDEPDYYNPKPADVSDW
jgi:type II secretory pathway pseudopilin PulG